MRSTNEMALGCAKLLLNKDFPTIEGIWQEGFDAAMTELPEEHNPYHRNTRAHQNWSDGWWAGFYGEAELMADEDVTALEKIQAIVNTGKAANHTWAPVRWLRRHLG